MNQKKKIEIQVKMDHFIHLAQVKSILFFEKKSKKPRRDTPLSFSFWSGYEGVDSSVEKTVFNRMAYQAGRAYKMLPTIEDAQK